MLDPLFVFVQMIALVILLRWALRTDSRKD